MGQREHKVIKTALQSICRIKPGFIVNQLGLLYRSSKLSYSFHYYEQKALYLFIIISIMDTRKNLLMPSSRRILKEFGQNIKLARLRRKLSGDQVAERANISRVTLWQVEKGSASVAMGIYCQVLFVLGLDKDLLKVAVDDALGRKLQDAGLEVKERAPKRKTK